jgi:hypothetical protein
VSIYSNNILPDFLILNTVGTREKERGKRKGQRFWSRGLFRSCYEAWCTSRGGRSRRAYGDDIIGSSLCSCCAPDLRPHTHRA